LKPKGQNGILQSEHGGISGPSAGQSPEVLDLIGFSAANGTTPGSGSGAGFCRNALACGTAAMTKEEERELRATLMRLQQEHRDLDAAIGALQNTIGSDSLQVQRLKKRKLFLRDRITFIEDQLTPDIIA
jgi:hypothetical protein